MTITPTSPSPGNPADDAAVAIRRPSYTAGEARSRARQERRTAAPASSGGALSVPVHTPSGGTDGTAELPAELFDSPVSTALLHQVVTAQLAAARQGTHSTKTRGEVRGGSKKPYRQKGTGRARQGSTRAPQFTGGGTVHGPTPRSYEQRTPKKMKAAALRGALTDRARHDRIHVFSGLVDGTAPSTKGARTALEAVVAPSRDRRRILAVIARDEEAYRRSVDNLPAVHPISPEQLNTYDVLRADDVVFTSAALDAFVASRSATQEADQ